MPHQNGNNITIKRGETLPITVTVYDSTGALAENLTVAKFALKKGGTVSISDAAINDSEVSIFLTQAETLLLSGVYEYEFRVKDADGEVDSIVSGILEVKAGPITVAI